MSNSVVALWIICTVALLAGAATLCESPKGQWVKRSLGGVLIALGVFAGILALDLRPKHGHKPVNVSDIHQQSDPSDPDSFTAGSTAAYFAAKGTWTGTAHGTSGYRIYAYHSERDDLDKKPDLATNAATPPLDAAVLPGRPTFLAALPTEPVKVVFAIGTSVKVWNQGYGDVAPEHTTAPVAIHGIRATDDAVWMLASPTAGTIQIYSIDVQRRTYTAVANTTRAANAVEGFTASSLPDLTLNYILRRGTDSQLYWWPGSGQPQHIQVEAPRMLVLSGDRILFAATQNGSPRACRWTWSDAQPEVLSCADQKELTEIHGLATLGAHDWVLATRDGRTSYWRMRNTGLDEPQDVGVLIVGNEPRPRGFVSIGSHLAFISGKNTMWAVRPGDHDSTLARGSDIYDDYVVDDLWPHGDRALFAARSKNADLGVEPSRWWAH